MAGADGRFAALAALVVLALCGATRDGRRSCWHWRVGRGVGGRGAGETVDGPGRGIPRRLRAGWEFGGAVGAGVASTQGKHLHDVSIGVAELAAARIGLHVWEG
ncbi:MAG: hypothetical protein JWN77_897 [Frankiales bacterium]|nr:hypothetical protein [Frankiales bacterium]